MVENRSVERPKQSVSDDGSRHGRLYFSTARSCDRKKTVIQS